MTAPERKPPSKAFLTRRPPLLNPLASLRSSGFLSLSLGEDGLAGFSLGGYSPSSSILPRTSALPSSLLHSLATSRLLESPPKLLPLFAFNAPLFFPASPPRLRRRRRRRLPAHACEKTGGCMLLCCSLFVSYSARKVNEFTRYEIVFVAAYLERTSAWNGARNNERRGSRRLVWIVDDG